MGDTWKKGVVGMGGTTDEQTRTLVTETEVNQLELGICSFALEDEILELEVAATHKSVKSVRGREK